MIKIFNQNNLMIHSGQDPIRSHRSEELHFPQLTALL